MIDLGKATTMPMATAGGNVLVTISYWKSIEHLHAFAHGPTHRLGWDWWAAQNKKYPHIGIMHETYGVPAGGYENIYQNLQPFGMGESILPTSFHMNTTDVIAAQIKYPVKDPKEGTTKLVGTIMQAKGSKWKTMTSRMGGEEDGGGEY